MDWWWMILIVLGWPFAAFFALLFFHGAEKVRRLEDSQRNDVIGYIDPEKLTTNDRGVMVEGMVVDPDFKKFIQDTQVMVLSIHTPYKEKN